MGVDTDWNRSPRKLWSVTDVTKRALGFCSCSEGPELILQESVSAGRLPGLLVASEVTDPLQLRAGYTLSPKISVQMRKIITASSRCCFFLPLFPSRA